ncbi:hydroxysteroid 11-beta-dehydrogenase 1-like protein isoform X4 [Microcebus murinus]|uniref:hydroxysteroid 11-beta-dehydrogenase 1-like protein isoform X4 n=1 Tax=Microcebus murinus TaxID=30608 RepID=UPI003F6B2FD9
MWARSHVTRANREGGAVRDPAGRGLGGRPEGVRVVPRLGPQPLWWGKLESRVGPQRAMKVLLLTALGALFFTYYWDDNFDPASLQGARVLLTGASAGVGEELAYHYARLGSHLVLTAYTEALLQKAPPRAAPAPGDSRPPPAGELAELRAADLAGAAEPDGQQGLPGGGVLAARPRAHVLLRALLGGQVRAGRLLRLPAARAGRAGRGRGHHHVRAGPPGPRPRRRGRQGRHEGRGGPGAQGGPGGDPRRGHARLRSLLPAALPPAVPAAALAAAPAGLVHPPGPERLGRGRRLSPRTFGGRSTGREQTRPREAAQPERSRTARGPPRAPPPG